MYKIITGKGSRFFKEAKQDIKGKVMAECDHGWKLQGGAQVKVVGHKDFTWYEIYQTLIEGSQNLIDYDILEITSLCDSLSGVSKKMSDELDRMCQEGWKIEGGASIGVEHAAGCINMPSYNIYQTVIKEK